ncbi:MAG: hypothetical protein OXO50_21115 [Caldilineaceae bacterium]|nr:hypothetical protein [Caldilineaceae bacterium]
MAATAIFYRGMYKRQLELMLNAQEQNKCIRLFMQPYSKSPIRELKDDPPSPMNPAILYLSTNEDFAMVSWRAEIVGWQDKQKLSKEEQEQIDAEARHYDSGLYGIDDGMVNLLQLRNVVNLDARFPVTELTKIKDGERVSENAFRSGWVYVRERNSETPDEAEAREAARERFMSPMISHLWHPDGTPFTAEEYEERGVPVPHDIDEQPILNIRE